VLIRNMLWPGARAMNRTVSSACPLLASKTKGSRAAFAGAIGDNGPDVLGRTVVVAVGPNGGVGSVAAEVVAIARRRAQAQSTL
jgi:hypothetical protein